MKVGRNDSFVYRFRLITTDPWVGLIPVRVDYFWRCWDWVVKDRHERLGAKIKNIFNKQKLLSTYWVSVEGFILGRAREPMSHSWFWNFELYFRALSDVWWICVSVHSLSPLLLNTYAAGPSCFFHAMASLLLYDNVIDQFIRPCLVFLLRDSLELPS